MDEQESVKIKKTGFVGVSLAILIALLIGAGVAVFVVMQKPELLGLSKGQIQAQAESDRLIAEVGKLISLPTDEKPTIATVSDVDKVKEQAFFRNAKNGDKVLIYTNAKKAILYRPTEKKVVEVGAVNINQQPAETPQATATPKPTPTATPSPTE